MSQLVPFLNFGLDESYYTTEADFYANYQQPEINNKMVRTFIFTLLRY